ASGDEEPRVRAFTLTASEFDWDIQPGTTVRAWGYNQQVPGPELRVRAGDLVRITLQNELPVATTIHWHGVHLPPAMDGPAGLNQAPVAPGDTFTYEFIADPAGSRMYHAHTDTTTQIALGLYGPLVIGSREGGAEYDRELTYMLSEWDVELTPAVATGRAPRGPRDSRLRGGELGTDLFLMNGHTHEAINPVAVQPGERILLRLMNMGSLAHPIHIHGHSFTIVATDGNPVPPAAQLTKDTVLIGPGERYDIALVADNPGVWMVHCHIEHHAANGMMTLLQYEGAAPTGPLKEIWTLPASPGGKEGAAGGDAGMHGSHGAPAQQTTTVQPAAAATLAPEESAQVQQATSDIPADATNVVMLDARFVPGAITVTAGTTVVWVNAGADWHSVAAADGLFASDQIAAGDSFSYTFDTPGTYPYVCKHHARQGMFATIVVT
ncbi:MAG: multicopper oxidase domain-containing protein, partial [Haloechinothrix sp.]